jgi:hypothetical protein
MNGLIRFRDIADAEAGRRIGLVWRASETRMADMRAIAAYMREALPDGVTRI